MSRSVFAWICALAVAFGGFLWGYEIGSINGVKEMKNFRRTFHIPYINVEVMSANTSNETVPTSERCSSDDDVETGALLGAIVSVLYVGGLVGALLSGPLSDLAGRKVTIFVGASLCAIGGALQASSFHLWMVFLGRVISGMGIGSLLQVSPLYIAEIAPKEKRGIMISLVNGFSTTGSVVGIVSTITTKEISFGWRVTLALHSLCGAALAIGALLLPETPRFLVKKHKVSKALKLLVRVHEDDGRARSELSEIQASLGNATHQNIRKTLKYMFSKSVTPRILIGISLTLVVRGVGTSIIMVYSVSIFCQVGVDGFTGTVVLSAFNFCAQIFGIYIISKCGRKPLLLLGLMVMGGALASAATLIQATDLEETLELSLGQSVAGYAVIALVTLFVAANTSTISTIAYIVLSEIYPIRIRGISASLSQIGWWGGILLLGEIGPILISSPLKSSGTLYLLSGMCLLAFVHILLLIPETKDQSLENIEDMFSKPWTQRANVLYYLRCGCFDPGLCKRRGLIQVPETDDGAREDFEMEPLQEPLDQISLSSADGMELDNGETKNSKI